MNYSSNSLAEISKLKLSGEDIIYFQLENEYKLIDKSKNIFCNSHNIFYEHSKLLTIVPTEKLYLPINIHLNYYTFDQYIEQNLNLSVYRQTEIKRYLENILLYKRLYKVTIFTSILILGYVISKL